MSDATMATEEHRRADQTATGPMLAADGSTLKSSLNRALRRSKLRALLLIAPTGGGKTLSGFLPSLVDLAQSEHEGLHTLYISPLKALAADI